IVLEDQFAVDDYLTSDSTIEVVYDMGQEEIPFSDKLNRVRQVESVLGKHESVMHTFSLADFFPKQMPSSTFEAMSLLKTAQAQQGENGLTAEGERFWRITLRIDGKTQKTESEIINDLKM